MEGIPALLAQAAARFAGAGAPLYLVGGWPRNRLLRLPGGDFDVCSALPGPQAAALFAQTPGVRAVDRSTALGTLSVVGPGLEAEYTAFRTESYGPGGAHRPENVAFGVPMEQDALRRDFTVNALYYDIAAGQLADPLGGLADLERRILRTCRPPQQTFDDDGLRLMRLVRLGGELGFAPEEGTFAAACERATLINDIAPERIRGELERLLLCDIKYPGNGPQAVLGALHALDALGLLRRILPELDACRGVGQRRDYHDYDVLEHCLHACAAAPAELPLRLAALLHDVGKPAALAAGGRMVGHDKLGEELARQALERLRFPNAVISEVCALVRAHMVDLDGRMGTGKLRWFFVELGRERSRKLMDLRRADVSGSRAQPPAADPAAKWAALLERMERERVPWTQAQLDIDGDALSALAGGPSPRVGALKRALHRHAVLRPADNNRRRLLILAEQLIRQWNKEGKT